ncbi:hypothetical protein [Marinobacter sp.]|uniref:hypothetical protein n=1 Tax=Marinobacter sp. TaxID=50741 RepID=UPI0025794E72|nr:hypothetical protein [Marinobacter sp.]|tara:strand:- start:749 stop:2608 length:1860 start_codon:yes stop_codon:yes gene_type:complete
MSQISKLDVSELDFDAIKENLKTFLNAQDTFTDYDFDGSALSVLIDLLAYNTHYNAYIGNMLLNEMFLDSAVKRSSAVSIAKHLGFTPTSVRSARANINLTVVDPTDSPPTVTIEPFTTFNTTIRNNTFTFTNLEAATIVPSGNNYSLSGLQIVEGTPRTLSYVSLGTGPDEKFVIPDRDIDTSTLKIKVQGSTSNTFVNTYTQTTDISNVNPSSKVFFVEMNPLEQYEVFFGDGTIGSKLIQGNLVIIEYLLSTGTGANASDKADISFSAGQAIGGTTNITVATASNPSAARDADTITDIKFKAPRVNAARNRAVTANDYKGLIEANFTDAESVVVYGGEDNVPPKFGKVMISLKPFDGFNISQTTKDSIVTSILKDKKVMSIQPEFIDPDFFFLNLIVNVVYNINNTTRSINTIKTTVENTIEGYFTSDLQKFDKDFNKSLLMKKIIESDSSIVSVIIIPKLQKRTTVTLNTINTFSGDDSFDFDNSIKPGSVKSSRFFQNIQNVSTLVNFTDVPDTSPAEDAGSGTLVTRNALTNQILNAKVGNVNYLTGEVVIDSFVPTALPNNILDFRVTTNIQESAQNIQAKRNQIIVRDKTILNAAAGRDAGLTVNVSSVVE